MDEAYGQLYIPRGAWLEERFVRCGKDCRCRHGEPHGTYWRLCWREQRGSKPDRRTRRRQRYVAAEHVAMYQQALELRRKQTAEYRWGLRSARAAMARARGVLKTVNQRTVDIPRSIGRRRIRPERM
jgi:hypothetical protein